MPDLNWSVFKNLPGDVRKNWELLCRELIRRNYARFGSLRAANQQPGVEFHLKLTQDCSLGENGDHLGWQCKWYDVPPGRQIGHGRRGEIEDSIRKTEVHRPEITRWVLWTKHTLTPTDQEWFDSLVTRFKLDHWDEQYVSGLLCGEAAILKETFFGDLILTPEKLERMHEQTTAPLGRKWDPNVHIEVAVEQRIKASLGTSGTWPEIRQSSIRGRKRAFHLQSELHFLRPDESRVASLLANTVIGQSAHLDQIAAELDDGTIDRLRNHIESSEKPGLGKMEVARLAARLRAVANPASISVSATAWEVTNYYNTLQHLSKNLRRNFFAVIGDAGFGKTYLAAELTKDSKGILLLAKNFPKGGTLNDLANRSAFGGDRMEQLLEAVDAAGARMGRRIPIVIDGLNESECPFDWRDLLEELKVLVDRTQNCVIIVTLRFSIAADVLPDAIVREQLDGFRYDAAEAVHKYFEYYKIPLHPDLDLPWDKFASPLFLSLFCQTTNPDRTNAVGPESVPCSLTAVFERYRTLVAARAAAVLGMSGRDVERALQVVAIALWERRVRAFDFDELRRLVGDDPRAEWNNSLARVLEDEGVLSRDPYPHHLHDLPGEARSRNQVSAILYDPFAGFLIADAVLATIGWSNFPKWITENEHLLKSPYDGHPLSEDIVAGIAGLLPRRHRRQLWEFVKPPVQDRALLEAAELEPSLLEDRTCSMIASLTQRQPFSPYRDIFAKLMRTRTSTAHPLNADFLSSTLRGMTVAQRDLRWTEWLRVNHEDMVEDLEHIDDHWTKGVGPADHLLATWVSWMLTSTVRKLRDKATMVLCRYGQKSPDRFFRAVLDSLAINDPYVAERMFAAAYGVAMSMQLNPAAVAQPLKDFIAHACVKLLGRAAIAPTEHWMIRVYFQGIVEFTRHFLPESLPAKLRKRRRILPFCGVHDRPDVKQSDLGLHIGMDFENYEVGNLFKDRSNYDFSHPEYCVAIREIHSRMLELGYTSKEFQAVDQDIGRGNYRHQRQGKVERYAKKYGWIGYYEKAGRMSDAGELLISPRTFRPNPVPDIDPSFPQLPPRLPIQLPDWLSSKSSEKDWLRSGSISVPADVLHPDLVDAASGPWIAVDGFLQQGNSLLRRGAFGFIRGLLVRASDLEKVISLLESKNYLGNHYIPNQPAEHYTFAGEIPWSREFAVDEGYDLYKQLISERPVAGPSIEILSHEYGWEDYHSSENRAGGHSVPSKEFSAEFGLVAGPHTFWQYDANGKEAAICYSPPSGCEDAGHILYLREDLVREYASRRNYKFVWVVWGERELKPVDYDYPAWARSIFQSYGHIWRQIVSLAPSSRKKAAKRSGSE